MGEVMLGGSLNKKACFTSNFFPPPVGVPKVPVATGVKMWMRPGLAASYNHSSRSIYFSSSTHSRDLAAMPAPHPEGYLLKRNAIPVV